MSAFIELHSFLACAPVLVNSDEIATVKSANEWVAGSQESVAMAVIRMRSPHADGDSRLIHVRETYAQVVDLLGAAAPVVELIRGEVQYRSLP